MTPEENPDICQTECVHEETVQKVAHRMPADATLFRMADLFKALGDPTRVKILQALRISELCVCDLASLLGMSSSAISHQLRVLRTARIVKHRKEGKNVIYSLDDAHIFALMEQGEAHAKE